MLNLYDYQQEYIDQLRIRFKTGKKNIVLCSATGSGKTVMFSHMAKNAVDRGKKVLIITDRKELFSQSSGSIFNMGMRATEIKPNSKVDFSKNIFVGMAQTLKRRSQKDDYRDFLFSLDLVIIDEAHKTIFDDLFQYLSDSCFIIGATATPHREGKQESMEKYYEDIVQVIDTPDLIEKGRLSNCKTYGVPINLKGVKTKGGDYDEKSMAERFSEIKLFHGVYDNYIRICANKKAIIFAPNVDSSRELVEDWSEKGLPIKHVDCYMTDTERRSVIDWFSNTDNAIISNYGILTTGFDVPNIEVVILYRATKSLPLFLQMVGRGSRVTDSKSEFTLLDFGNNIKTHGYWEAPREWTLKKKEKKKGEMPIKDCPECSFMMHATIMECPECGHVFEKTEKEQEEQLFVELQLMTNSAIIKMAERATIKELIAIQQAKGYSKRWIYYYLKTKEDYIEYGRLMKYHYLWAQRQIKMKKL